MGPPDRLFALIYVIFKIPNWVSCGFGPFMLSLYLDSHINCLALNFNMCISICKYMCTSICISFSVFIVLNSNLFWLHSSQSRCSLEPKNFIRALGPLNPPPPPLRLWNTSRSPRSVDPRYAHISADYFCSWDHVWYLHTGHPIEEYQQRVSIFFKNKLVQRMNEDIRCITNEGKTAKNKWQNYSDFLPIVCIVYKKLGQFVFHTLLANLFKQRYISSVTGYEYLSKLIIEA